MAKYKDSYICTACGTVTAQWKGQCSQCNEWNTIELSIATHTVGAKGTIQAISLQKATIETAPTISTGIPTLDAIFGNGLVLGSSILLGGEPGIGKSTLVLQMAGYLAQQGHSVLYASGEESVSQLSLRAKRLNVEHEHISAIATSKIQHIIQYIQTAPKSTRPSLLILDSIQTFTTENAEGISGNVTQVKAVSSEIIDCCKAYDIVLLIIGHVTKDGSIAGPKLLEHLVDTVLSFEGDRKRLFRMLRVFKNRFGSTQEVGVFQMEEQGLKIIEDPSTYFLEDRDPTLSGTAVVMTIEGQLPFAVEVQALVTRSYLTIPRRIALGYDSNRLTLLLAVLEKRLKCNFGELDIHTKIGGGIRLTDPAIDLAIVVSVLSSMYDIPLPERSIVWGEVDLNGQIRPVANHVLRYEQAKRLGYKPIIAPKHKNTGIANITELGFLFTKSY